MVMGALGCNVLHSEHSEWKKRVTIIDQLFFRKFRVFEHFLSIIVKFPISGVRNVKRALMKKCRKILGLKFFPLVVVRISFSFIAFLDPVIRWKI